MNDEERMSLKRASSLDETNKQMNAFIHDLFIHSFMNRINQSIHE